MLRWSIATVSMGGTLEAKLAAVARAGFRAVEIFENDLTFFSGKPRDVRQRAEDLGLEIIGLQPLRDFEAMPEPLRTRNFDRAERKFDLMEELGTRFLGMCSSVSEDTADDKERAAADLAELADRAARRGFRLGYEALAWGRYVRDWMQAYELVCLADRPNLGIVLDSFHICVNKNPLAPLADIPASRIGLVQLSDAPGILMDPMSLSRHHRCFPGQGDHPVAEFLDAVMKTGYRGPVSLEAFNDQFRGAPVAMIARDGMRCLQMAGERLDVDRVAQGLEPLRIGAALPAASHIDGIEFVEFATGESSAFVDLLKGLGFSRVARHRSKDVDLYRQNDLNIVVNREQEGFAHAFGLLHGTSMCALGLRFDKPEAALERANALHAPTYFGRIGPGEALIPAVAGVENSLIYFMGAKSDGASNWDRDFVFDTSEAPGALTSFDHFSNVLRRSEFLSWMTFYKSVLGLVNDPQVEVADPYGAFYSRVIRSADAKVRIPLNIADGGSTAVSRFIDAFGGSGVQHIALETGDIFTFVEAALSRGVTFLTIPDNYYDDLSARFADLNEETIERMRALGILYDRSRTGEFFQIYTATFEKTFFFEIVERRNYELFGAANTPVRLAAQVAEQELS
ncbi:MAG: Xylose isomerase protein [Hyphomicrobiales bacterium]|nr:Xylose isomerase protein [Hyphomicrobiales bacterium]